MSKTNLIIIVAVVGLVIADIALALTGNPTISQAIWKVSNGNPIVPFAAGLLCGHLFWRK